MKTFLLFAALLLVGFSGPSHADPVSPPLPTVNASPAPSDGSLWGDIRAFVAELIEDVIEIGVDLVSWVFDSLMALFVWMVSQLPAFTFQFDWTPLSMIFYFLDRMEVDIALGIIGAGFVFRLTRKLLTLGWW